MSELTDKVERSLKGLDGLIIAVKATGGHKYRQQLKGTKQEIDQYIADTYPKLQGLLISLLVAEEMLQEKCPEKAGVKNLWQGCACKRWDEYLQRKKNLAAEFKAKMEEEAKKMVLRRAEEKKA